MEDVAEEWRPVAEDNRYQVSSAGRVRGQNGSILRPGDNGAGYCQVSIAGKQRYVHRLVALAFIPPEDGRSCVDHVDGNPKNNAAGNLRWATRSENLHNQKTRTGRAGRSHSFDGLHFVNSLKRWRVEIQVGSHAFFHGYFDNFPEALACRNEKKREAAGDFANIIDIATIDLDSLPQARPWRRALNLTPEERKARRSECVARYQSARVTCECGAEVRRGYLSDHRKTARHRGALAGKAAPAHVAPATPPKISDEDLDALLSSLEM